MTAQIEMMWPGLQVPGQNGSQAAIPSLAGLVKVATEIAQRRRNIMLCLKCYLKAGDREKVFEVARELCGMEDHGKESYRTPESVH